MKTITLEILWQGDASNQSIKEHDYTTCFKHGYYKILYYCFIGFYIEFW